MLQRDSTDFRASCSTTSLVPANNTPDSVFMSAFAFPSEARITSEIQILTLLGHLLALCWGYCFLSEMYSLNVYTGVKLGRKTWHVSHMPAAVWPLWLLAGKKTSWLTIMCIVQHMFCKQNNCEEVCALTNTASIAKHPFIHFLLSQIHRMQRVGRDPQESLNAKL